MMVQRDLNIVISGFMGTGKSSVGREVARQLGRPFVDMDTEIEARAGKAISSIFAEDGEAAFRALEANLCQALSRESGLVVATGGGALVNADNLRYMLASGPVFCLHCTPQVILERLAQAQNRPLLDVADRRAEIEQLMHERQTAYARIPRQIEVTDRDVSDIAAQIVAEATSILLPVRYPGGQYSAGCYPVHVSRGLLKQMGPLVQPLSKSGVVAIVTNPTVGAHYQDQVCDALAQSGLTPMLCSMPDGEAHKTLETLTSLYNQFLKHGLDRSGCVLALGGGVVTDVAGFAAATFMRGLPVVQVPTSLLAMVDASVGGKTAVDMPQGKNLVGAFKQPSLVIIDPDVLHTLPQGELVSGVAELIKHGLLADPELWKELTQSKPDTPPWTRWIARSLQVKIEVVEQDPFERGQRATLNLGHTSGHALEQLSGYTLRHGEAVSIGIVVAARIAAALGLASTNLPQEIAQTLSAHGLPVQTPDFDGDAVWEMMHRDKKKRGKKLRWILPIDIGEVNIVDNVPREIVIEALRGKSIL